MATRAEDRAKQVLTMWAGHGFQQEVLHVLELLKQEGVVTRILDFAGNNDVEWDGPRPKWRVWLSNGVSVFIQPRMSGLQYPDTFILKDRERDNFLRIAGHYQGYTAICAGSALYPGEFYMVDSGSWADPSHRDTSGSIGSRSVSINYRHGAMRYMQLREYLTSLEALS